MPTDTNWHQLKHQLPFAPNYHTLFLLTTCGTLHLLSPTLNQAWEGGGARKFLQTNVSAPPPFHPPPPATKRGCSEEGDASSYVIHHHMCHISSVPCCTSLCNGEIGPEQYHKAAEMHLKKYIVVWCPQDYLPSTKTHTHTCTHTHMRTHTHAREHTFFTHTHTQAGTSASTIGFDRYMPSTAS